MSTWRRRDGASASITAFCTAGVAPIVPDSPMPFAPSGLMRGRRPCRRPRSSAARPPREGVAEEVAGLRVALLVVDDLLEERLVDAGGDAAVTCPSAIIGLMIVPASSTAIRRRQLHAAGLRVDLDDRDVGPERERRRPGVEVDLGHEPSSPSRVERRRPDPATGDRRVPRHGTRRARVSSTMSSGWPRACRRRAPAPGPTPPRRPGARRRRRSAATLTRRSRCPRGSRRCRRCSPSRLDRDAEAVGDDLRQRRLVALAVGEQPVRTDRLPSGWTSTSPNSLAAVGRW